MNHTTLDAFGLDPDITHLNHGAYGVAPRSVRRAADSWREHAERNPHRFNRNDLPGLIQQSRIRAADFLGVDPASVGLVRNVSEGVSAVMASIDLEPGDELVVCNHGYGAVRMALQHWADRRGAVVREATFDFGADDDQIVDAYLRVTGARTRLVVVDQISSPTATVLPVARIAAAVEAPVFADAAHVPGTCPTDIASLGVAYWVGNLHKWAYTPRGSAVLWTRLDLRPVTFPGVLNWQLLNGYSESFDYPGTWDYAGWLAIGDGLDYWASLGGWEQVQRLSELVEQGRQRIAETLGGPSGVGPATPAPTMRMVRLPDGLKINSVDRVQALYSTLSADHRIEAAVTTFGDHGYLRLSAAPYNTIEDYDRLATAVRSIIAG